MFPLSFQVHPGSLSDRAGLQPGDAVVRINNLPAEGLDHDEAKQEIVRSGNAVEMLIERYVLTIDHQ